MAYLASSETHRDAPHRGRFNAAARQLAALAAAGLLLVLAVASFLVGPDPAALGGALAVYGAGAALAVMGMNAHYPHQVLGAANVVTLLRLMLVAALVAALVGTAGPWSVLAIAALVLSMDGVDGWLARRQGLVSRFGGQFDMEVDSLFALTLALAVWLMGHAPMAVLLLGLPRYAFGLVGWVWPWINRPVPDSISRKLACVVQIGTLIALLVPQIATHAALPLITVALGGLALSFGRDIRMLRAMRDRAAPQG